MKLPILNEIPTSREMLDVFGGYNHNLRIGEGEFYDMKNLTSSDYPVLSTRPQRGVYSSPGGIIGGELALNNPQGMVEKDSLICFDGGKLYINGHRKDIPFSADTKTVISMGAYIIVMPDKKYVNTADDSDYGDIELTVRSAGNDVSFDLCKNDGTAYGNIEKLDTAPSDPKDGQMYIDISKVPHTLRQYSATNAEWIGIATTYVRISFGGAWVWAEGRINVGDGITISGIETEGLTDLNGTMVVRGVGRNYIIVTGIIDESKTTSDKVVITRKMPEMDFIIESGNRLWGCKYGLDIHNNFVNEIYASKLGDFKNWNVFDSISTDSYVATVGSDGPFTGAITHLGYPIFFKENCMHKVYGNLPANYQVQTTPCRGVQNGCSKSLAIVNEVLYYKSRNGVCMYDGSLPAEISSALGDVNYSDAVAGTRGNKYYISMKDSNNDYHLFVCDTKRGLWHREDNTHATEFCNCRGELYYIDDEKCIKTINPIPDASFPFEESVDWMAESGIIGTNMPDKKYISRLDVRMLLSVGTRVYFYIEYDSCGKWEHLFTMTGTKLQSFAVPIRPRRCDHMRIRIVGDGEAKIFSICKTIEQGSDI